MSHLYCVLNAFLKHLFKRYLNKNIPSLLLNSCQLFYQLAEICRTFAMILRLIQHYLLHVSLSVTLCVLIRIIAYHLSPSANQIVLL